MPFFTPPTVAGPSLASGEAPLPAGRRLGLWRYFRQPDIGVNVYILSDGTVTQIDPIDEEWATGDVVAFYGGHGPYEVTTVQAALLTAAGYTVT